MKGEGALVVGAVFVRFRHTPEKRCINDPTDCTPFYVFSVINMKRWILPLLSAPAMLLWLAGCSLLDDNNSAAPEESGIVVLQEGQRIALPAFDATLRFVEKTEDSRCAANVVCIWEGRVKILLDVARSGQGSATFEMVGFVGPDGNADAKEFGVVHEALGLRFTLERVDPYPIDGVEQTDPVTAAIRVEAL